MMVRFHVVVTLAVCCLIPVSAAADWLKSTCKAEFPCPERNTACYPMVNQCLCLLGYYYSVEQHRCVEECAESDLQGTFLTYRVYATVNKMAYRSRLNKDGCVEWCRNEPKCRAALYIGGGCTLVDKSIESSRSARVVPSFSAIIYQKMCA